MSDSDRSFKEKKKRKVKKVKQSEPDFAQWNDDQKKRFQAAKNEVEREVIIGEVQQKQDEVENNLQILQHKLVGGQQKYQQSKSSSSFESSEEEESFSRPEEGEVGYPKKRIKRQEELEEPIINTQKKSEFEEVIDSYEKAIRDVTLKRNQIDYLLMKVYYNKVMEGAFVRIQEPLFKKYALAQILAVVEGDKAYQLGDTMTYKLLKLQIAEIKEPKYRHITLVSNSKIETQEYILWKKNCEALGIVLPLKEQLSRKFKEIQDAFKMKLTDEDIEKKIITTVEVWMSQVKPQVHNNDLPVYQNFINNQISIQKQTLEQIDEFIQEITESQVQEAAKVDEDEINKLVNWRRQQRGARDRLTHLQQQLERIKSLYLKHQEKQEQNDLKAQARDKQQNNHITESLQSKPTRIVDSQTVMKQIDKGYNKNFFEDTLYHLGSEQLKILVYQKHNRPLEIDNMIDNFILEEL